MECLMRIKQTHRRDAVKAWQVCISAALDFLSFWSFFNFVCK
jgi:hypothetical protein